MLLLSGSPVHRAPGRIPSRSGVRRQRAGRRRADDPRAGGPGRTVRPGRPAARWPCRPRRAGPAGTTRCPSAGRHLGRSGRGRVGGPRNRSARSPNGGGRRPGHRSRPGGRHGAVAPERRRGRATDSSRDGDREPVGRRSPADRYAVGHRGCRGHRGCSRTGCRADPTCPSGAPRGLANSWLRDPPTIRRGDRRPPGRPNPGPDSAGQSAPAGPGRADARRGPAGPGRRHRAGCRAGRPAERCSGPRREATTHDQRAGRVGQAASRADRCRGACATRPPTDWWSGRPGRATWRRVGRLRRPGPEHRRNGPRGEPIAGSHAVGPHRHRGRNPDPGRRADRTLRPEGPAERRPGSRSPRGAAARRAPPGPNARARTAGPDPAGRCCRPLGDREHRGQDGRRNPGRPRRPDPRSAGPTRPPNDHRRRDRLSRRR